MLIPVCCHCGYRLYVGLGWAETPCPRCRRDPFHMAEPPEDDDPTDEWEVGTSADDIRQNVTEGD